MQLSLFRQKKSLGILVKHITINGEAHLEAGIHHAFVNEALN